MKYTDIILDTFKQSFPSNHFNKHKWIFKLGNQTNIRDFQCFEKSHKHSFVHSWQNITYSKILPGTSENNPITNQTGQALLNQVLSLLKSLTIWNQTDLLRMST